ncbi:hypothetical protein BXY82_0907 [Gelidibacter sediminis]|uniref:Uncharacterized protein n=1 Tax=Gelidibacter sediminis TaxID=1608710 RepID=A0A4R7Q7A3_9FLAO|nr:hypothetical protein [Gelidibacter sediminis]TDU43495.1 hypothetical protein BXY82_0907 [Gelidibacter sediminis]
MRNYKYLIISAFLIIIMVLIFLPRPSEKIYIVFNQNEIQCNSNIIEENWQKGSYLICEELKFINFIKNPDKNSFYIDLNKIGKLNITSKRKLLNRFNNDKINREKNNFDLLSRDKKIDFYLMIKDIVINKFEAIPVVEIKVLSLLKLTD